MERWACLLALVAGCATSTKEALVDRTLHDRHRRLDSFEATLRVLDQHPEYVDEFFTIARRHEATLGRVIEDQSAAMDGDRALARLTAEHLGRHPRALGNIMQETLVAIRHDQASRQAVATAMAAHADISAGIVTDDGDAMAKLVHAMGKKVEADPHKRDEMRKAVKELLSDQASK
jgi:hypothetical protein